MKQIETQHFDWAYMESGPETGTPLVLCHGFTGCASFWDEVIAALPAGMRIIAVDLPGHGGTETLTPEGVFTMSLVAKEFAGFLDIIRAGRTNLWGYSMGGRFALFFALTYPERIDRLILESASPGIADSRAREKRHAEDESRARRIERLGVPAFVDDWMEMPLFASQKRLPLTKRVRARKLRLQNSATGLAESLRGMGTGSQPALHERLHELTCPVLLLAGEQDSKFRATGEQMHAALPEARLHIVPGAGHAPHWEQPDAAAALVGEFLTDRTSSG